jgi:hypothetical protein
VNARQGSIACPFLAVAKIRFEIVEVTMVRIFARARYVRTALAFDLAVASVVCFILKALVRTYFFLIFDFCFFSLFF